MRLVGTILADTHDEYQTTDRRYLSKHSITKLPTPPIPSPTPNSQSATDTEDQPQTPPLDGRLSKPQIPRSNSSLIDRHPGLRSPTTMPSWSLTNFAFSHIRLIKAEHKGNATPFDHIYMKGWTIRSCVKCMYSPQ